ncbi:MAG TPA: HAD-IIIC family phosphatase [Burkholderiales bacterium]|nr:HAD-IIIC family phosphatase [Burkholderiales bacterium]
MDTSHLPMHMEWLPVHADFRAGLRAAQATSNAAERFGLLVALAQHRLGFVETIQLARVLGESAQQTPGDVPRVRLAVLASSTVDQLVPAIKVAALRRRLVADVYAGTYGQHRQEVLDTGSALHRFGPQTILLSITAREAIAGVPLAATPEDADRALVRFVEELRVLWKKARETLKASILQQTFLDVTDPLFGSHDRLVAAAPSRLVARLNDLVSQAAASEGVALLDIARASQSDGVAAWFDTGRWMQAKMEIAPQAAPLYGDLVARLVAAQRGLSKKCLVLDLDNTLWGGVIGDDGLEGIVLGEGNPVGEAHLALQRYALQLKARGIILAVCSKNDPAVAEAALRDHPEMALKRSDFAAFIANWEDKAANLVAIAKQLNIGLDSLVFVDDNPAERARVREGLPVVAVPELPEDATYYVRCIANAGYFEAVSFTADDRQRAAQYAANAEREAMLGSSENMDEFLRGLGMSVVFGPVRPVDLSRVTQLINKTNQFNPTTRRYTAEEVEAIAASPESVALQFRLLDRFGDNGLISVLILRPDSAKPDVMEIDTWVMSCRVFGRGLEFETMNIAVEAARSRGVRSFRASYVPTKKNGVISDLYPRLGFTRADEQAPADGGIQWRLNLSDYVGRKTHIERSAE